MDKSGKKKCQQQVEGKIKIVLCKFMSAVCGSVVPTGSCFTMTQYLGHTQRKDFENKVVNLQGLRGKLMRKKL